MQRARAAPTTPLRHLTISHNPHARPASEPSGPIAGIYDGSIYACTRRRGDGRDGGGIKEKAAATTWRSAEVAIALNTHEKRRPTAEPSGGSEQQARERWRHGRLLIRRVDLVSIRLRSLQQQQNASSTARDPNNRRTLTQ